MLKPVIVGSIIVGFLFGPAAVLLGLATVLNPAAEASCRPTANVGASGSFMPTFYGIEAPSVREQLMQIRFGPDYPTMTAEQARNAAAIAHVARDLGMPPFGLQISLATAIQESKLVNVHSGDADSVGLFQQRPSAGWGTVDQITNPRLATLAFFGRAQHTSNGGLLDLPGWQQMDLAAAAQAVQVSSYPGAYAEWENVAGQLADVLGRGPFDSVEPPGHECIAVSQAFAPYTVGTLNLLGAGHTDDRSGGGHSAEGFSVWSRRLPRALQVLRDNDATVVGIQEVHGRQARALATTYSSEWGMWPKHGNTQNRVIWSRRAWRMTDARAVDIPYFHGHEVRMPLVQLTSRATGQAIWIWSIHNPASTRGNARTHRIEALHRQLDTLAALKASGLPAFIVGDFNDGRDGENSAHCALTPTLTNAFGPGGTSPCRSPSDDAPIDHIFGTNIRFASAKVDQSTQARKISDHPLVVATALGSTLGCRPTGSPAERGLTPDALKVLRSVNAQFGPHTYLGIGDRPNRSDHPTGRAVDVMITNWSTHEGITEGTRIADWVRARARELGVTYVIWRDRIWNTGDAGWSPYTHPNEPTSDPTLRHLDHVHVSVAGDASVDDAACPGSRHRQLRPT